MVHRVKSLLLVVLLSLLKMQIFEVKIAALIVVA